MQTLFASHYSCSGHTQLRASRPLLCIIHVRKELNFLIVGEIFYARIKNDRMSKRAVRRLTGKVMTLVLNIVTFGSDT